MLELLTGWTKYDTDADLMDGVTIVTSDKPMFPMFRRVASLAKKPRTPMNGARDFGGLN